MDAKLLLNKAVLKISEKSPVILLTIGVIGVVAGTVMAVKATKNSKDIDDELKEDLETLELKKQEECKKLIEKNINVEEKTNEDGIIIKECSELLSIKDIVDDSEEKYFTKEEYNKLRNKIVFNATKKYIILYSKAAILELSSIICIIAGFRIISKRYAALAMAYTTLDSSFREYRKRIQKEIGEDKEEELYYGYKKELKKIKDEKGKDKEIINLKQNGKALSPYAFFFDDRCLEWSKDPGYNETFLKQMEKALTRLLGTQGEASLHWLKEKLGVPKEDDGGEDRIIGWKVGHPNHDGYISLGLLNAYNKEARKIGSNIWLIDPNCDGLIIDTNKFRKAKNNA